MLRSKFLLAAASAGLITTAPALASEPVADRPTAAREATSESAEALPDDELSELRGGQGVVVSNQTLVAITSGNVINGGYAAGNVSLSDNALSNFNGIGNLLINTGAQVSLQTGMNVTINVGE